MLDNIYLNFRKNKNKRKVKLENKEIYYEDLLNIEHSLSGRENFNNINTFILEAEQQLVNSIELFELGYFDCAYYSLRSSIEISTTIVFLTDVSYDVGEKLYHDWKSTSRFPMQSQMIKKMLKNKDVFSDMQKQMYEFFSNAKNTSKGLNKYVHKQGLQNFYVVRNHPINNNGSQEQFIKTFESYLEQCIGIVAVMRLAIDPFPILLMDEEILYRCFSSITEPYSESFVNKYIGNKTIKQYKNTQLYMGVYDWIMGFEKKTQEVFNVTNNNYIDSKKLEKILKQSHILSENDYISVLFVSANPKVVKVYLSCGFPVYITDKKSNRLSTEWSSLDFKKFLENKDLINQEYQGSYISVFKINGELYYIEHNIIFSYEEIIEINNFVRDKIKSWN